MSKIKMTKYVGKVSFDEDEYEKDFYEQLSQGEKYKSTFKKDKVKFPS